MQGRDQSVIEHIYEYCKEIKEELEQIDQDKDKFISSNYDTGIRKCIEKRCYFCYYTSDRRLLGVLTP